MGIDTGSAACAAELESEVRVSDALLCCVRGGAGVGERGGAGIGIDGVWKGLF